MSFAANRIDGCRTYYEDDGGSGPPVVFLNGLGDPIASSRRWGLSTALAEEYRLIFVDHRGHGRSDKPHDSSAYLTRRRVADLIAVLDQLGIERAHFIGASWGARLAFGLGELQPDRVLTLTMGGQTPYAMNREAGIVKLITRAFTRQGSMVGFLKALGGAGDLPPEVRADTLANDFVALGAAWAAALSEGDVAPNLHQWREPCLIYAGTLDADFFDGARRAATEIPNASFVALDGLTHLQAHENVVDILPHVRHLLSR